MKNKSGLTLVEILVSLLILSIAVSGIVSVFIASERYVVRSQRRLQAAILVRQILEGLHNEVRQDTWDTGRLRHGYSETTPPITIDNITYNLTFNVSNLPNRDYRQVTVNVSWLEH